MEFNKGQHSGSKNLLESIIGVLVAESMRVKPELDPQDTHISDKAQSLSSTDIPFPSLFDLSEDPRFDESPTADHDTVDLALF